VTPEIGRSIDAVEAEVTPLEVRPLATPDNSATQPPKAVVSSRPKAALPAPVERRRAKPEAPPAPVPLAPDALIPLEADEPEPPFEPTDAVRPVMLGRLVVAPLVGRDVDATVRAQARDLPGRIRTVRWRRQKLLVVDGLSDSQADLLIQRLERAGIEADRRSKEELGEVVDLGRGLPVRSLAGAALGLAVVAAAAWFWTGFQLEPERANGNRKSSLSSAVADVGTRVYAGYEAAWWRTKLRELTARADAAPEEQKKVLEELRRDTERKARRLGAIE
jgi:hypothetical protein